MRRILAVFALTLLAVSSGVQAQELRLDGLAGGKLGESELAKGSHVIVFWASWSPRGRDVVDRVNTIAERWKGNARVLTVNFQEDPAAVRAFLNGKAALQAEVFMDRDGELSKKYRVNSAPWLVILEGGRMSLSEKLPTDPNPAIARVLCSEGDRACLGT